ncbi:MAG: hypothetical protein KAW12_13875 [Candidatus Aminicenantes bacterium]|nr:hypothetical protein [Candidatus Aminicenantes bacterium]
MIRRLKDYKEEIGTITAIIGVVTVLLYIFGFASSMFHWIMTGFRDVPGNPLTYLLQGGGICILALYNFAFSLYNMIFSFDIRYVPILLGILVMSIAFFYKYLPEKVRKPIPFRPPYGLLWIVFFISLINIVMLCIMDIYQQVEFNLLFGESIRLFEKQPSIFIDYYIYVLGWWAVFLYICHRTWNESPFKTKKNKGDNNSKNDKNAEPKSWTQRHFPILRKLSAAVVIIMILYYPIFINIYSGHTQYHMVQLVLKNESGNLPQHISNNEAVFGLLYETDENYALYKRFPRPYVIKLEKALVSAILIYPKADITKLESYRLSKVKDRKPEIKGKVR